MLTTIRSTGNGAIIFALYLSLMNFLVQNKNVMDTADIINAAKFVFLM